MAESKTTYDVKITSESITQALDDLSDIEGVTPTDTQAAIDGIFITVEIEGEEKEIIEKIKGITGYISISKAP